MVVTLDDACGVSVSYMGTEPPLHSVHALPSQVCSRRCGAADDAQELDYQGMDREHRQLLKVHMPRAALWSMRVTCAQAIRDSAAESLTEPPDRLALSVTVPDSLDKKVGCAESYPADCFAG